MSQVVEKRIQGSRRSAIVQEFFGNTFHFPLANILLELLAGDSFAYLIDPDLYVIFVAGLLQAYLLGSWHYRGQPRYLLGNLIAPAIYSCVGLYFDGTAFWSEPQHQAYWGLALTIGTLQQLRHYSRGSATKGLLLLEQLVRTSILLVMYAILESLTGHYDSLGDFLSEPTHAFVAIVIPLLGLSIGVAATNQYDFLQVLRTTALQLQRYSEWLLGRELLGRAINDPDALGLRRCERAVLFTDIRGFTAWSEARTPEQVAALVDHYYHACEAVWIETHPVKVKLTADELLLVYASAEEALAAAHALHRALSPWLAQEGLAIGSGLHYGSVMEGLFGSGALKIYDVMGDTVNTAKRICDQAGAGELLLSREVRERCGYEMAASVQREVRVKGKEEALLLYTLLPGA